MSLVDAMLAKRLQTVDTSSCGRLFDAVAALLDLTHEVTFEGQAAIALEMIASCNVEDGYAFDLQTGEATIVDFRGTIAAIVKDLSDCVPAGTISARFHNTLSNAIVEMCKRIRKSVGLNRVCLSGGTFQNRYLLSRTVVELRRCGFEIFLHANVPTNDGGISLGQAVIANELARRGA
jgi:hydrogenase maturation protein HypF